MDGSDQPCKDYYKVLEIDYDATDDTIRLSYRRLALKWHPDKHQGDSAVTAKFQEINEAYKGNFYKPSLDYDESLDFPSPLVVLSDPATRLEYDISGSYEINRYTLWEYLARFKGMILTCNGLGISHSIWTQQLMDMEPN